MVKFEMRKIDEEYEQRTFQHEQTFNVLLLRQSLKTASPSHFFKFLKSAIETSSTSSNCYMSAYVDQTSKAFSFILDRVFRE